VTQQGQEAAAVWREAGFARGWAESDVFSDMLDFPRHIAAAVVAGDNPAPACVVDVGSGPGAVLSVFLERFPSARGIWTDASEAMLGLAREQLAPFGDRVEYRIVDMTDLAGAGLPPDADVITTSRAAHHLDREGLFAFYAQAAALLPPGGWLVNLDHIGPDDVWDQRLRAARKQFATAPEGPRHHHNYPLTSVRDHLEAYAAAGISDAEVVWRAFYTCLFMGRTGPATR
jgi:SAM-dependent methyltransferase